MNDTPLLDAAGRLRSPATMPGFHRGRLPRNRGLRYSADPPPVEEVVAIMRVAGESAYGLRTRALIVVLWRAGCASAKPWLWRRVTSTESGARSSCAEAKAAS